MLFKLKKSKIKKTKILMLNAPSFNFFMSFPYLALPLLIGQLRSAKYEVYVKDFSFDFFKDISSKKYVKKIYNIIKKLQKKYPNFQAKFERIFILYEQIIKNININNDLTEIQKISLMSFVLFPFSFNYKQNNTKKLSIIEYCSNKNINFYVQYLESKIKRLPTDIDVVCISKIPDMELYGILTLAKLLKEKYKNKKIVIGGYWFSYIVDELVEHPEFFDVFCDYIMIGDGEKSLIELIEYINNERSISEVSNVMYKDKKNRVVKNGSFSVLNINDVKYADYSDYELSKTKTISMMLSKGCYWGKCKFCTYNYERHFQIKTVNNAIDEIKFYIEKYKVNHIVFVDDAVSAEYYKKLSTALIENNINISFSSYVMFDEKFSREVLENCKKAGISDFIWGLETHSKKVFDYVSKSGCFEKRSEILKNAHELGIYNTVNMIESLPGEQYVDLLQTVKFIYDNIEYIDELCIQKFRLQVGSVFSENPEIYDINVKGKNELSLFYDFEIKNSDITENNSYYNFLNKNKLEENKSIKSVFPREFVKINTHKYLEKYAPDLL